MKMLLLFTCLLAASCAVTPSTPAIPEASPYAPEKSKDDQVAEKRSKPTPYYVAGGPIYSVQNFNFSDVEDMLLPLQADITADDSFGVDLRGGYRAHDHFAAEAMFQYFFGGNIDVDITGVPSQKLGDYSAWALFLNGKGYFMKPDEKWQPYAGGGIGVMTVNFDPDVSGVSSEDETDLAFRIMAGTDFQLTPQIYLFGEISYIFPTGDLNEDVSWNSIPIVLGVQGRF